MEKFQPSLKVLKECEWKLIRQTGPLLRQKRQEAFSSRDTDCVMLYSDASPSSSGGNSDDGRQLSKRRRLESVPTRSSRYWNNPNELANVLRGMALRSAEVTADALSADEKRHYALNL